jgi:hypothetical protein
MEPNPYESPQHDNSRQFERKSSRIRSIMLGLWIGLCIGIAITVGFGPLIDGPPSLMLSLLVFSTAFSATGIVVGAYQQNSVRVGTISGLIFMSIWAVVCNIGGDLCERNPWAIDPWIVIWLPIFGGLGVTGGGIIGMIFSRIRKFKGKLASDEKDAITDSRKSE